MGRTDSEGAHAWVSCVTQVVMALQLVSGLLWLLPAAALFPALVRTWRKTASALDVLSTPMFFAALNQPGFTLRWWLWPHTLPAMRTDELMFWAGLYVLSSIVAVGVLMATIQSRKLR